MQNGLLQLQHILGLARVRMMGGKGSINMTIDHNMFSWQLVDQCPNHIRRRPVSRIPNAGQGIGNITQMRGLQQSLNIRLLQGNGNNRPLFRGRNSVLHHGMQGTQVVPVKGLPCQNAFKPIVFGGVMGSRHHNP